MAALNESDPTPNYTNRLIHETSPYLLQHAHNPVDWYPWGEEAFEKARQESKPVFLSIGYSSCHWCHVMERESFEQPDVGRFLNEHFISIKVDREERPDLDEIYMAAVQLLTQRGGWPMSTWLTPEGRPFHGGTYFPKAQFLQLLANIAEVYRSRRQEVEQSARQLTEYMAEVLSGGEPAEGALNRAVVENAVSRLGANFDETYGGFGRAPKFPPSTALPLLFHVYVRTRQADPIRWATRTLTAMALGGIRDHLGGGFHRYSTDRQWLLPHFEKMLYDNAQLSRIYADGYRITGRPEYREVAEDTYDWVLREMTGEEGAFYSTLDADSEGEEGKFYVWSTEEIVQALGREDGELFCQVYNCLPGGNFHDEATGRPTGLNIPHLTKPLTVHAGEFGEPADAFKARMKALRDRLLAVRVGRVWPGLDDKILTAWNGLMIGSLAYGGQVLEKPEYVAAAARAADFILARMRPEGRLLRSSRKGQGKLTGYLEDYAFMVCALLDLHEANGEARWLTEATTLADAMIRYFWDEKNGGFYNTASDHEEILIRTKSSFDQAQPSGNSMAALGLTRLTKITGNPDYLEKVGQLLNAFLGIMQRNPSGVDTMIRAAALYMEQANAPGVREEAPGTPSAVSGPIRASAELAATSLSPGGRTTLTVALEIAEGWHIHSEEPGEEALEPTQVRVSPGESVSVGRARAPEPKEVRLGFSDHPLSVYEGDVAWEIVLHASKDAQSGTIPVRVFIDVQPCTTDSCAAPATLMIEVPLEIRV
jgi:hypothetical protein